MSVRFLDGAQNTDLHGEVNITVTQVQGDQVNFNGGPDGSSDPRHMRYIDIAHAGQANVASSVVFIVSC